VSRVDFYPIRDSLVEEILKLLNERCAGALSLKRAVLEGLKRELTREEQHEKEKNENDRMQYTSRQELV
jgi:hypothetical protein